MAIAIWMVLAALAAVFIIASKFLLARALFRTKVLQWARHAKRPASPEAAWSWRIALALVLVVGVGEYLKRGNPALSADLSVAAITGLFLVALSLWIAAAALDARKQYLWFWQVLGPKEELPAFSTDGPYAIVRHPRELTVLLLIAGLALTFGMTYTLILTIIVAFPAAMFFVSAKDRALMEQHGKAYIDYSRTTKKLVPFVW
jgi:protein-S-isoprenylcysteine O-methyltransferase Ste14